MRVPLAAKGEVGGAFWTELAKKLYLLSAPSMGGGIRGRRYPEQGFVRQRTGKWTRRSQNGLDLNFSARELRQDHAS